MSYNPLKTPHNYQGIKAAFVTPADTALLRNIAGVRFIQACGAAGTVTFRLDDDTTLTVAVPIALNQSFEIGSKMVNIMSTGTTATNIAAYY